MNMQSTFLPALLGAGALLAAVLMAPSSTRAQALPPQLFSEMDGIHFLDDGTALPIWGYGWVTDGFISLPGPLLTYTEGQQVDLNFTNPSPESHTIHLHGLDVDQANDGVPATSFQVVTGGSTVYSFVADHPGTFLYHCHVTTTLHLTMGMYGMILVTRPDQALWEGGPVHDGDVPLLFSDLEVATNLDPVGSFPFHDIRPDVFMVNGLRNDQLLEPEQVIGVPFGDTLALRLGSMAYSRVQCVFPPELHAVCHMSDGRPVPQAFAVDTLDIFPGERFTVLIAPDDGWSGTIPCAFWNMVDPGVEDVQELMVQALPSVVEEDVDFGSSFGYPNPAHTSYHLPEGWHRHGDADVEVVIWSLDGQEMFRGPLPGGRLDVADWPAGSYVAQSAGRPRTRFAVVH